MHLFGNYRPMRWNEAYIPTLKEVPKEAVNVSHILLLRGGFIKLLTSGVYAYLPLGWKVLKKIMRIVREEMDRIGAQELLLPALTPASIWEETGRWESYGSEMFRLKDRKMREYALAPTHEEIVTELARRDLKSYRDLPQIWYQIQIKYRDEIRPRGAVLRARSFIMKDSYSFDIDYKGLDKSYKLHYEAYNRIFDRIGFDTVIVSASSGLMGGSESQEFMVVSPVGEDIIVRCPNCGYAANMEIAELLPSPVEYKNGKLKKEHTPVGGTVKEISEFFDTKPSMLMKSILFIDNAGKPFFIVLRGDYELDNDRVAKKFPNVRPAEPEEIKKYTGAQPGYVSPVGLNIPVYLDNSLLGAKGMISGANEDFYHYTGIDVERDFEVREVVQLRKIKSGDLCSRCKSEVEVLNAIELGHIFKLGTKYSESMGAFYTDRDGKENPIVMGSYGIGIERIMATAIEIFHDKSGIIWPDGIAPFDVIITNLEVRNPDALEISEKIYKLLNKDFDVLYDDRDLGPGFKLKDADLIGIPIRITIGKKSLAQGKVEVKRRNEERSTLVKPENVMNILSKLWKNGKK